MSREKCFTRLLILVIMLNFATAFEDEGNADLCNQNLRALSQFSKEIESISSKIEYISLCHNDLSSIQKDAFYKFTELEKLVLSGNHRFQFPADGSPVLESSSLTDFICAQCGIVKIFNHSLREIPLLEYLVLSNNQISHIEKSAFQNNRHLQILDFSGNLLRLVPSIMLAGLSEISILDLSFNRELAPVGEHLFLRSGALKTLKCNDCGFTAIHRYTFAKLTNLKELHLHGNPVYQNQQSEGIDFLSVFLNNSLHSTGDDELSEEEV